MIGKHLNHYEVVSELGRGGMGEVYRARDTKLGREVAIKLLPAEFSQDGERLVRLEREARMLAALNHPNIAAIHGLEESNDTRFLVLELVEGDTLADRLKRGAIPAEESLKLALQIAEALETAHEKGVVHRDLKPANIKITPEGRVKVLDFGLAKALIGDQADVNLSNSPTLSMAATQAGIVLGTAAYMSPEQASGEVADHRADVWAFGVVLFEMLTGRQLFTGKTAAHVMGAVLNIEPNWESLPPDLHPRVRVLLERSLEKESKDRLSGISDARVEIQKVLAEPAGVLVPPTAGLAQAAPRPRLPWIAAIVVAASLAGVAVWILTPAEPVRVVRVEHQFADGLNYRNTTTLAVSPDGGQVAYDTSEGVYLLSVDQFDARPISETPDTLSSLMFSPDGQWLGYYAAQADQLQKLPVSGGASVAVADIETGAVAGASWGQDNTIILGLAPPGIVSVSGDGGTPEPLAGAGSRGATAYVLPQLLPDGETLLFTINGPPRQRIALQAPDMDEPVVLFPGGGARYVPTGHIVYWFEGALYAQRFDVAALETTGGPVPMVDGVANSTAFRVSDSGTLVYFPGNAATAQERSLVWVDREGNETPIGAEPRGYEYLRISHDGRRVAVDEANQGGDIWVWTFASENAVRLTTGDESELYPVWTQDDGRIAFATTGQAAYWKASSNTGTIEPLTSGLGSGTQGITPYFFADADQFLVFREQQHPETRDNIGMVALDGEAEPAWLLASEFQERNAELSPDGNWMAYQSNESGQFEVYVRPFPDVDDDLWTISTSGGTKPVWGPDGSELFYLEPGQPRRMMRVEVETGPAFAHQLPQELIDWPYDRGNEGRSFDIAPDGSRFLTTKPVVDDSGSDVAPPAQPRIHIVLNWFEELKERVPVP